MCCSEPPTIGRGTKAGVCVGTVVEGVATLSTMTVSVILIRA